MYDCRNKAAEGLYERFISRFSRSTNSLILSDIQNYSNNIQTKEDLSKYIKL